MTCYLKTIRSHDLHDLVFKDHWSHDLHDLVFKDH